jgi:hypothetical protein
MPILSRRLRRHRRVDPLQRATHELGSLIVGQSVGDAERCDGLSNSVALVQSVPHMQRSRPNASMSLMTGSQMSLYGNGSWDRVQAPLILILIFDWLARASTFGRSAHGSAGGGGARHLMADWLPPAISAAILRTGLERKGREVR